MFVNGNNSSNASFPDYDLRCEIQHPNHKVVAIVVLVFSAISVLSSVIVVFFYLAYSRMRKEFLSLLIFLLAVLDIMSWGNIIITAAYYLANENPISCASVDFCIFMAWIWSFSELLNYGVTLLISISLYLALMKNEDPAVYKKHMLGTLFIVALVLSLIPFWVHANGNTEDDGKQNLIWDNNEKLQNMSYGPVDFFKCWITNRLLRIVSFYIPMWLVILFNVIIMIIFLRGLHTEIYTEFHDRYQTRFTMFPLIMMICYAVSSIRRIMQAFMKEDYTALEIDLLMYILMPLQGLFNTVVFGMFEEFIRVRIIAFLTCDWKTLKQLDDEPPAMVSEEPNLAIGELNTIIHEF